MTYFLHLDIALLRAANHTALTWPGHFPHVTRPFGLT